jgi:signal transduction histidine kinase
LIQDLWIEDVDDSLLYQKEKILEGLNNQPYDTAEINTFTKNATQFDIGIFIYPVDEFHPDGDSIYNNNFYDVTRKHIEPFRELQSYINAGGKTYQVIVRKDMVESQDLIRGIALTQIILFTVLLMGILLINSYLSKKTWKPFYKIIDELRKFKIDKEKTIDIEMSDIDEFKELNESVRWLAENNINIFKSQKEFTENAAHETQTPVAVIKSQIDNLMQDSDLTESQSEKIHVIDKNISLLTKINRNLLLLSKIENNQFQDNEIINLSDLITDIYDTFKEQIALKGITYKADLSTTISIQSNAYLWQLLITNLFMNAIKYNTAKGLIEINTRGKMLIISNTGKQVTLPVNSIFERFYRQDTQTEGSGLGLAIAKKIADTLKLGIMYEFHEPNIHTFTIIT